MAITTILVMPAFRAGVNMIGVSIGQSPIARIECKGDLATISEQVATIRAEHSSVPFKIMFRHERKPRGWDSSELKWKTDNLPESSAALS